MCIRDSSTDDSRLGVGFWSAEGDSQKSGGTLDEDGQSTSDTDSYFSTSHGLKNYNHAQTVTGQASVGSSGDNLTETWTSVNGVEYAHAWMIFGDEPSFSAPADSSETPEVVTGLDLHGAVGGVAPISPKEGHISGLLYYVKFIGR